MGAVASRLTWRRLPALVELVSVLIGYAFYATIRVAAPTQARQVSLNHAAQVIHAERLFGIYHELSLSQLITGHSWIEIPASYYYATLHFIITPAVLVWLWKWHRNIYAPLRSAIVLATAAALVIYATWPLAPPRYVNGGYDTVLHNPVFWAAGHGVSGFVNEYAAMPSLHVGWAVWCAVAVTTALRTRLRFLAWIYPLATTFVVVSTSNHYFLDAAGGALDVTIGLYLCGVRFNGRVLRTVITKASVAPDEQAKERAAAA